jgi:selenocysteine-specific elongation factor
VAEGLFFHREAVDRAREILVEFMRKEGRLESVKFKYLLDTTRKFAIPLLDYFDDVGVTRRVGNTRYLKSTPDRPAKR